MLVERGLGCQVPLFGHLLWQLLLLLLLGGTWLPDALAHLALPAFLTLPVLVTWLPLVVALFALPAILPFDCLGQLGVGLRFPVPANAVETQCANRLVLFGGQFL